MLAGQGGLPDIAEPLEHPYPWTRPVRRPMPWIEFPSTRAVITGICFSSESQFMSPVQATFSGKISSLRKVAVQEVVRYEEV